LNCKYSTPNPNKKIKLPKIKFFISGKLCNIVGNIATMTNDTEQPIPYDFRQTEQLISKPTDDNDDYEDEYTDSY
jgi:hypothetical protein